MALRHVGLLALILSATGLLVGQNVCDTSANLPCVDQPHAGDEHISGRLPKKPPQDLEIEITVNGVSVGAAKLDNEQGTFAGNVDALNVYDTVEVKQTEGPTPPAFPSVKLKVQKKPEPKPESSGFDVVLGVGSLIVGADETDYKPDSQTTALHTTNLGRATPQLLTGAAFQLPFGPYPRRARERAGPRPWYAFLSLKFSPDSSQTFSGYVLGGSFKLAPAFSLLAGYALTPMQEPSPGFRAAAVQLVEQNPNLPIYQRFDPMALGENRPNAFDGFPLFVQNASGPTTTRVFSGDPTVIHYHGGFVIGVAIPVSVRAQLTKSSNQ